MADRHMALLLGPGTDVMIELADAEMEAQYETLQRQGWHLLYRWPQQDGAERVWFHLFSSVDSEYSDALKPVAEAASYRAGRAGVWLSPMVGRALASLSPDALDRRVVGWTP